MGRRQPHADLPFAARLSGGLGQAATHLADQIAELMQQQAQALPARAVGNVDAG